jgi:hypothetical protein
MSLVDSFAFDPLDTEDVRLEKKSIFIAAGACSLAGLAWSAMYWAFFGWGFVTALPLTFTTVVGTALFASHTTKNHRYAVHAEIFCIMYVSMAIQRGMGSVFDSGIVSLWAFLAPVLALIFYMPRVAVFWFILFLINLGITVGFDDFFGRHGLEVRGRVQIFLFAMNLGVASLVVFAVTGYFVRTAAAEKARAERLLLAILPRPIAERLKAREGTIADNCDSASVLFADMVGSTQLFGKMSARDAVAWLN